MPTAAKMPGRSGFAAAPRDPSARKVRVTSQAPIPPTPGIARHSACIAVGRDQGGAGDVNLVEDDLGGDSARRTRGVPAVFRLSPRTGSDAQLAGRRGSKPGPTGAIAPGP